LESLFLQAGLTEVRADALEYRFDKPEEVRDYAAGAIGMLEASRRDLLEAGLIDLKELDRALREWDGFACSRPGTGWASKEERREKPASASARRASGPAAAAGMAAINDDRRRVIFLIWVFYLILTVSRLARAPA
jgi:hypothetical protein